jgi:putative membrane protein
MTLFALVLVLEVRPMITFIRWRIARRKSGAPVQAAALPSLIRLDDLEVAIILLIPFVASLMARGVWLF